MGSHQRILELTDRLAEAEADLEARERDIAGWIKQRDEAIMAQIAAERERDTLDETVDALIAERDEAVSALKEAFRQHQDAEEEVEALSVRLHRVEEELPIIERLGGSTTPKEAVQAAARIRGALNTPDELRKEGDARAAVEPGTRVTGGAAQSDTGGPAEPEGGCSCPKCGGPPERPGSMPNDHGLLGMPCNNYKFHGTGSTPTCPTCPDDFGNWLAGFIDGEGFFQIKRTHSSWRCCAQIKLRDDDEPILHKIAAITNLGHVRAEKRHASSNSQNQAVWAIESKDECVALVDLLDRYPLRAKKSGDYAIWRKAVLFWAEKGQRGRWGPMEELEQQLRDGRTYHPPRCETCGSDDPAHRHHKSQMDGPERTAGFRLNGRTYDYCPDPCFHGSTPTREGTDG